MPADPSRPPQKHQCVEIYDVDRGVERRNSHMRPRPGRRRRTIFAGSSILLYTAVAVLFALLCDLSTAATTLTSPEKEALAQKHAVEGRWLIDVAPDIALDFRPSIQRAVRKREEEDKSTAKPSQTKTTSASGSHAPPSTIVPSSAVGSDLPTETGIETAPTGTNEPLPTALDGGIGTNYTEEGCPTFLTNMVGASNFTTCLPISVLLQNSVSFFQASRSLGAISKVLQTACTADQNTCSTVMSTYAQTLVSPSACSSDWNRQQPLVRQVYNALLAYNTLYQATCIRATPDQYNGDSTDYCYADAITNATAPSTSYIYFLPLGIGLPAGTAPTCNQCTRDTMNVFYGSAANRSQPVSLTYVDGAQVVDLTCGPGFVNATAPNPIAGTGGKSGSSAASRTMAVARVGWVFVAVAAVTAALMA